MIRLGAGPADLDRAAQLLAAGKLVAFPTETVYGLGADAANPEAVARIFEAKRRPADHPVIVHLPDRESMDRWGRDLPPSARTLARAFWPGPLTLVVRRAPSVSPLITGGQDTVGLRVPGNRVALDLLARFGGALAAPSANRFGRISPTRAEHVVDEFPDEVAAVVDGGPCEVGLESTILDLTGERPLLLRPGMIPADAIGRAIGESVASAASGEGPRASGRLASHYAPRSRLTLVEADALVEQTTRYRERGEHVRVLCIARPPDGPESGAWTRMPAGPDDYARVLYAALRSADAEAPDRILVEMPPDEPRWAAVRDRLARAAA